MLLKKDLIIPGISFLVLSGTLIFVSCNRQGSSSVANETAEVVSPVQVTPVTHSALAEYIELTAVSVYQQKSYVKANLNGYVQSMNAVIGQQVHKGSQLFRLITKEAKAIGNAVNELDPGLRFSGVSVIRADQAGFVTAVNHQTGDYVQDGEALAAISNQNSFVFLLDLPYELHRLVAGGQPVKLTLPDGTVLHGQMAGAMPSVDSLAQTQRIVIRIKADRPIPEGLIARVQLVKASSPNAQVLPKEAVLANESADEFWVMKMINDSTAVKVPVTKGIEDGRFIEILSPVFNLEDRVISVGNYGLADTARVKVVKSL